MEQQSCLPKIRFRCFGWIVVWLAAGCHSPTAQIEELPLQVLASARMGWELKGISVTVADDHGPKLPAEPHEPGGLFGFPEPPAVNTPLLTIGRLPPDWTMPPEFQEVGDDVYAIEAPRKHAEVIWGFADGDYSLYRPDDSSESLILLVAPALNDNEYWFPTRLRRQGDVFLLDIERWTDGYARFGNIGGYPASLISLGRLEGGNYELRWHRTGMFEKSRGAYALVSEQEGIVPFTVAVWRGEVGDAAPAIRLRDEGYEDAEATRRAADAPPDAKLRHLPFARP